MFANGLKPAFHPKRLNTKKGNFQKCYVPLRPILSAIGSCGYKLSKFLLPFIEPITTNEFTVKDSFSFVEELKGLQNCGNYFMASFDIKSLFTNVPLDETINIVADSLYSADMSVLSLSKNYF